MFTGILVTVFILAGIGLAVFGIKRTLADNGDGNRRSRRRK